ncbi:type VII secretion protein EccB [Streptomyces sp. NPDC048279]|uniref:type VII secretion protein EccB n=1 Tax=Streptomyces sp. NPDC048279 TaxID=3154714 RepID=UPI0034206321
MQSKRDQMQAHMFLMGRLTSSMLRADPDAPESPQGRTNRGVAISVLIAVVVSAAALVIGLIAPGKKDSWQSSGGMVVDRDTGSRYLYVEGRLRPVRNYTSARLLAGADLTATTVGTSSLHGVPRGAPVGISGAPDTVPKAADLSTGPWQVCSGGASASAGGNAGTMLAVGSAASGTGLGEGEALLVSAPDSSRYLVWRGSRLLLDRQGGALEALGYESVTPVPVTAAFLDALPAGPDLAPPDVPGRGEPGPSLGGRRTTVGQVFKVASPGAGTRYYLLRRDGLGLLTKTGAALALGDPRIRNAVGPAQAVDLGAEALAGQLVPRGEPQVSADLPSSPPRAVDLGQGMTVCVRVQPGSQSTQVSVSLVAKPALGPPAQAPLEGLTPACLPVDRVIVPPGGGALVQALSADGGDVGGTAYLVADSGMKYRVPSAEAMTALGYDSVSPVKLPSLLLSMLPTGPDLSRVAAARGKAVTTAQRCAPLPAQEPGDG